MKRRCFDPVFRLLSVLTLGLICPQAASAAAIPSLRLDHSQAIQFTRPPLRFEVNEGQTDPAVRFTARDRDGIAYLTADGAVFQIARGYDNSERKSARKKAGDDADTRRFAISYVRMNTVGANPKPRIVGIDRLPGVTNYFLGNDPSKWRTNVAGYARVKYEKIYSGIDLVYYGNDHGSLEYDFIVAPGADPAQIALSIENSQRVEVESNGDLIISAATGTIRKPAPHVYQEIDGKRREIVAGYRLLDTRHPSLDPQRVAFALGAYDRSRPLVIDPQVIYATYLGGSSTSTIANEGARGVAVDAQGSVYVVGVTISGNFPTKNPAQNVLKGFSNAFITKLDANGQLVYSTYLGGSGFDEGTVIKVDDTGAAYVGGTTGSIDFPSVNAALNRGGRNDGFLTKLSPSGSQIVYSTYIGGTDNDSVEDLALDAQKNVYIVGNIAPALGVPANDFPTVNPIQAAHGGGFRDGFISKINSSGSTLLFSTYLGGDGDDFFQSIIVNSNNGDLYLGFFTDSSNFASTNLMVSIQASSNPGHATGRLRRVPETLNDYAEEVNIRRRKLEGITGESNHALVKREIKDNPSLPFGPLVALETDFRANSPLDMSPLAVQPQVAGGGLDVILISLDQDLNTIKTISFGGSAEEVASAGAIDSRGAAYVIGNTRSTDLPVVDSIQATRSGGNNQFEGFLAVFAPGTFQPLFATYLGGTGMEFLNGVTVDPQGNIYVVGETFGGFPNPTTGALQPQLSGRTDAFIIKISPVTIPLPSVVDFDGDGKSDVGIYRDGVWAIQRSSDSGITIVGFGSASHTPVNADYDGDGKTDEAVYFNGVWSILRSSDGGNTIVGHGGPGFIPVPADYDGDGKADVAVYKDGVWSIIRSSDGGNTIFGWGGSAFTPVPADYDGDGKADIAVYNGGVWSVVRSTDSGNTIVGHGGPAFAPVPADYDGDGKADIAVYLNGVWSIIRSTDSGNTIVGHGGPAFTPVPADYDGDGKADIAVYHSSGVWSIKRSSDNGNTLVGHGGAPQDVPLN